MSRKKTGREGRRAYLERLNDARLARLLQSPSLAPFVPDEGSARGIEPGDLRALRFVHDGDDFLAVVGEVLGHGFSNTPVMAIYRGDPCRIWTLDRGMANVAILVGVRAIRQEVPFALPSQAASGNP